MKLKKLFCSALIVSSVCCTGAISFADSPNELNYSTKIKIVNNLAVSEKSTQSEPIESDNTSLTSRAGSNYTVTSKVACKSFSGKAIATSSVTRAIDFVSAKVRIYDRNGSLDTSKSQSQKKTSFISATAVHTSSFMSGSKAYGNHEYRDSGFKTIYHETVDRW
ncbi:hypothetical protein PN398_13990 [Romboutsia sp. 1001216sp1]|uniref:hypothetical protein n=1 Tax=Romboutsia sp. 1001216sp1 TaxID=2986997 RepID=UPI00233043BB|nr:hypothetical protein [Romboutsia sp. 1001216sp1]MDB8791832.1 hypothetical protein [Romboutsia sp. 1001216sp1]